MTRQSEGGVAVFERVKEWMSGESLRREPEQARGGREETQKRWDARVWELYEQRRNERVLEARRGAEELERQQVRQVWHEKERAL
jgi:hypothetical protein